MARGLIIQLVGTGIACAAIAACSGEGDDNPSDLGSGGTAGGGDGDGGISGDGHGDSSGGAAGDGDGDTDLGGAGGSSSGSGGSTSPPPSEATFDCADPPWNEADFTVFEVGEGQTYATPGDVPWESLGPGSLIKIHHRSAPYRDKWVLNVSGTEESPVVVLGVPEDDELPQISGDGATTSAAIDFWNEERSVIKVGGSNVPDNPAPSYIYIDCLDISGGHEENSFTNHEGDLSSYNDNAAGVTIESGDHIYIRNSAIHGNGNGVFSASASSNVTLSGNHIYGNGNIDSIFEHNSYTESDGIVFEFNHYGPLCDGCPGNNLKDRSAGTVVRYNWIEAGNRQLDLVDSEYAELIDQPKYRDTFVYGNVLVEPESGNSQIIHYGGDSGEESRYRKGTLHLFHNTVVSTRSGNTTLARLSSNSESMLAQNNIVYATAGGSSLAILDGAGDATLENNWLPSGFRDSHSGLSGTLIEVSNVEGQSPGFVDFDAQDFSLTANSEARDAGAALDVFLAHPIEWEYARNQGARIRVDGGAPDMGAFSQ